MVQRIKHVSKKDCLRAVQESISRMKTLGLPMQEGILRVDCTGSKTDAKYETWAFRFHNLSGRDFRSYIKVIQHWKNGGMGETVMPVTIWHTQKEFMAFMERECDK